MMILLDRSGAMSGGEWTQAKTVITDIVNAWDDQILFGLDVFPDGSTCGGMADRCGTVNPVAQTCAPDNAINLVNTMNSYTASGGWTPLYCSLANFTDATTYGAGNCVGTDVLSYIVVVSCGWDTCSISCNTSACEGSGTSATQLGTKSAELYANGITTIAIGFGSTPELEAIAANGGLGVADGYFEATESTALHAALDTITAAAINCLYDITINNEVNYNEVDFSFIDELDNEEAVPYDENCASNQGWHWTASYTQIEFCEAACDQLQDGGVTKIHGEFGCP